MGCSNSTDVAQGAEHVTIAAASSEAIAEMSARRRERSSSGTGEHRPGHRCAIRAAAALEATVTLEATRAPCCSAGGSASAERAGLGRLRPSERRSPGLDRLAREGAASLGRDASAQEDAVEREHHAPVIGPSGLRPRRLDLGRERSERDFASHTLRFSESSPRPLPTSAWATPELAHFMLQYRDLRPEDYDLLSKLDEGVKWHSTAATSTIDRLPKARARDCVSTQCGVCLQSLPPDADVVQLPCRHAFHSECISRWLTQYRDACPFCSAPVSSLSA